MSDFSTAPDYPVQEQVNFNTLVSKMENGYEQRRAKWPNGIRKFTLSFSNRPASEFQTIRDFYIAKLGEYSTFTWTNPNDSVEYTVRFDEGGFKADRISYDAYNIQCTFIEVK